MKNQNQTKSWNFWGFCGNIACDLLADVLAPSLKVSLVAQVTYVVLAGVIQGAKEGYQDFIQEREAEAAKKQKLKNQELAKCRLLFCLRK